VGPSDVQTFGGPWCSFREAYIRQDISSLQWCNTPGAMHRALLVDELVRAILDNCEENAETQAERHCTFLALVLTSTTFCEAALDQLWSKLPSIVPLMSLIPGLFVQDGTFVSARFIAPSVYIDSFADPKQVYDCRRQGSISLLR
jgi:hypothetical protein